MGFVGERSLLAGAYSVPNIDVNYGLGPRIQLKYELPLSIAETRAGNGHVVAGLGNSLMGVKYRFYAHHPEKKTPTVTRERESVFALSVYPQLTLNNPTRSAARGIVEAGPQLLLPLEASAKIGLIRLSGEAGYRLTSKDVPHSWLSGILLGHEFKKETELYFELYDEQDVSRINGKPKAAEIHPIEMAGRTIHASTRQPSWIAYVGIQFLSARHRRHNADIPDTDQ